MEYITPVGVPSSWRLITRRARRAGCIGLAWRSRFLDWARVSPRSWSGDRSKASGSGTSGGSLHAPLSPEVAHQ